MLLFVTLTLVYFDFASRFQVPFKVALAVPLMVIRFGIVTAGIDIPVMLESFIGYKMSN